MNKDFMLFNLREASEEILRIIHEVESDPEYGYGDYVVGMTHLYHHINTAWNARGVPEDRARQCSEQDFFRWRQFPSIEEIYLGQ